MAERQLFKSYNAADASKKENFRRSIAFFTAYVLLGMIGGAFGPILPFMAEKLNRTIGDMSYLVFARSIGAIVAGYLFGRLYGRYKTSAIMFLNLILMAVMMIFFPVAPTFILLLIGAFFIGIFHIGIDVGSNSSLIGIHGDNSAGFINALHGSYGVGAFFAPLLVTQSVLRFGDFRWAFYLMMVLLVINAAVFFFMPGPVLEDGNEPDPENRRRTDPVLLWMALAVFALYVGIELGFTSWIFTYMLETEVGDVAFAGLLNSLFWVVFTGGRFLAIPLGRVINPKTQITINITGVIASALLLVLFGEALVPFTIGVLSIGFFLSSTFPSTMAYANERISMTAKEVGLIAIVCSVSAMILPWVTGQLFALQGPEWLHYCTLALSILIGIVFAFMVSYAEKRGQRA